MLDFSQSIRPLFRKQNTSWEIASESLSKSNQVNLASSVYNKEDKNYIHKSTFLSEVLLALHAGILDVGPRVLDIWESDKGQVHFIQEKTQGEPLKQICKECVKTHNVSKLMSTIHLAKDQIEKLHKYDIIHGDLNLTNIFIDYKMKRAVLIDYEFAQYIDGANSGFSRCFSHTIKNIDSFDSFAPKNFTEDLRLFQNNVLWEFGQILNKNKFLLSKIKRSSSLIPWIEFEKIVSEHVIRAG